MARLGVTRFDFPDAGGGGGDEDFFDAVDDVDAFFGVGFLVEDTD